MSRPIRIAYPGAWYHVMNRGRRAEKIFLDKHDYQAFFDLLQETSEAWNIRIAAYCLMPNHYHLLVHTPEGNISRAMRHVNGVYTQRFNRRHGLDGQLFRGRYKSILVHGDSYLLQLVRYIHRNPQKAAMVKDMKAYPWSSHKAYLSVAKKWDWLHKKFILELLTREKKSQFRTYRRFVSVDDDKELEEIMASKRWPSLLGPKEFIDWAKATYQEIKDRDEIPQARDLYLDADQIIFTVCDHYNVARADLFTSKRGTFNEPRCTAIYLIRKFRHDTLRDIGKTFNLGKYSSVSSIIERMKSRIKHDRNLRNRIKKIETQLNKSQEQT
jgi:REP-associated tyrosine transposase